MKRTCILVLLISTLLAACNFPTATAPAANDENALAQIEAANPTSTPSIHYTAQPTDSILPLATPKSQLDQLNLATVVANLDPLFSLAQVLGMAHLEDDLLLVTIEVPGGVQGDYYASVGNEQFKCEILSQYPNHIYCHGKCSNDGQYVSLKLFEQDTKEVVFEAQIGIPPR